MCTDGLTNFVKDDEIESIYKNHVDFEKVEKKAEEIIEEIGF